jgi:hypothetical protein
MGKFKMRKPNPKGLDSKGFPMKSPMKTDEESKSLIPIVPPADLKSTSSDFSFDASLLPSKPIYAAESTGVVTPNINPDLIVDKDVIVPDKDTIRPGGHRTSLQHFKGNIVRGY